MQDVSIIVANWNGGEMLARCLSSLLISARASGRRFELLVIDDSSRDGSDRLVARRFPQVRLVPSQRNVGFARVINRGAWAAKGRVLVLCNNDLVVKEPFIGELVKWFDPGAGLPVGARGELFAVSAKTVSWSDGRPNQLCMGARWRGGRVTPAWSDPAGAEPCLFAQAGAAAYDAAKFRALGGLSLLYEPGYWEDYDLSWRAARRGWAQIFDPAAFALHVGGGSMARRFGGRGVELMKARNHLIFEAANLTSPRLLAEWVARLPLSAFRDWQRGHQSLLPGLLGAARRTGALLAARAKLHGTRTDEQLLAPWRDFEPSF